MPQELSGESQPLVLVIDPDESVLRLLRVKLTRAGFRVSTSAGGEEGLRSALDELPAAVLIDGTLPGLTAQKLIGATALQWGERRPGIIVLSPLSDLENIEQALRGGCDDYVTKPFSPTELVHRLLVTLLRRSLQATASDGHMPGADVL